jgi:hypothetical protein
MLAVPILVVGCGRVEFDRVTGAPDADGPPTVSFGAGCAVGLEMNESGWSGAADEVRNRCDAGHGAAVQGAGPVDDAVRGRVGQFPAPSGCVRIADAPALHATTGLTLSAWIYPLALDGTNPHGVIAKRTDFTNDDAEYTMFVWTDNNVWVDIDGRNDRNHGARQLVNGQWQQITTVYDGTQPAPQRVRIYVDGVLDAVVGETSASLTAQPNALSIGCLPELPATGPQIAFAGRIDDAAIWTRAFSAQEVADWYQRTKR